MTLRNLGTTPASGTLELQADSGGMCSRQLQNEVPAFAFLVIRRLLSCEYQITESWFQIKVIKLLFSSRNKTNSTSQHILLKMKEKIYLAVPYKSQTTVLINPGFWVEGSWVWGPDRDSRVTLSNRSNFGVLITNWGGGGIYLIERLWDKWNNVYGLFSKMATQ